MDYSYNDEVKSAELFREEYRDLIRAIKVYEQYEDEECKIPHSSCEDGKVMQKLTVHKSRTR